MDTAFDPHRAAEYFLSEVNSNKTTSSEIDDKIGDFLSRWVNLLQQCRWSFFEHHNDYTPLTLIDTWLSFLLINLAKSAVLTSRSTIEQIHDEAIIAKIPKRDKNVCYLTRSRGTWLNPLAVVAVLPNLDSSFLENVSTETATVLHSQSVPDFLTSFQRVQQKSMLNAYLDVSGWAKLVAHGGVSGTRSDCSNMWLVHKPAYEASVQGYFKIPVIDGSVSEHAIIWTPNCCPLIQIARFPPRNTMSMVRNSLP